MISTPSTADLSTRAAGAGRLDVRRSVGLVVYGGAAWAAAAGLVHLLNGYGLLRGVGNLAMYIVAVPLLWGCVVLARRGLRLAGGQLVAAMALATTAALMLDGVAVMWFPGLYGPDAPAALAGAALILWGAGVGQALAFILERR